MANGSLGMRGCRGNLRFDERIFRQHSARGILGGFDTSTREDPRFPSVVETTRTEVSTSTS